MSSLQTAPNFSEFLDDFQSPQIDSEYPMYGKGGYHPVHLGDLYDNGRYRIIHKIGAGDTSTIWLARDSACWVALRILIANESPRVEENIIRCHEILAQHGEDDPRFIIYTRYFHIDSPNGRHLCLVLPFYGPSLHSLSDYMRSRMKPGFVQALSYQATEIVRDLHTRALYHGDVKPGNLLLRIRNLDHLDHQGIYRLFGQPTIDESKTESGRIPGPEAPRYMVGFLDFMSSGEDILLNEISIVGFDHAFELSSPKTIEILPEYLAPEVAVAKPASPASEVWTLGVTILNMRSGISLFPCHVDCPAHLVTECVKYFGRLPASWERPFHDEEGGPTLDKTIDRPREVSDEIHSLKQWISDIWDEPIESNENESTPAEPFIVRDEDRLHPKNYDWLTDDIAAIINYDPEDLGYLTAIHDNTERPFPQHYANRVWEPSAIKIDGTYLPDDGEVGWLAYFPGNSDVEHNLRSLPRISAQEADLLYDLLRKVFVYEERISVNDASGHPWFKMGQEKA